MRHQPPCRSRRAFASGSAGQRQRRRDVPPAAPASQPEVEASSFADICPAGNKEFHNQAPTGATVRTRPTEAGSGGACTDRSDVPPRSVLSQHMGHGPQHTVTMQQQRHSYTYTPRRRKVSHTRLMKFDVPLPGLHTDTRCVRMRFPVVSGSCHSILARAQHAIRARRTVLASPSCPSVCIRWRTWPLLCPTSPPLSLPPQTHPTPHGH